MRRKRKIITPSRARYLKRFVEDDDEQTEEIGQPNDSKNLPICPPSSGSGIC